MKIIIDRIEENFFVVELENKEMINIPKSIIPTNAKVGDVISIEVDVNETEERKKKNN
jgi:DUF3006 family protein